MPRCGNGLQEPGEQCDAGPLNSLLPDAPCRPDCSVPRCGDGIKDAVEACDETTKACDASCRLIQPSSLVAFPAAAHLGSVGIGQRASTVVSLFNPTGARRQISGLKLDGCSAELSVEQPPAPWVEPGASLPLQVRIVGGAVGTKSCLLRIDAGDGLLLAAVSAAVGRPASQTDHFRHDARRRVDVLFVVDPSQTMAVRRQQIMTATSVFAEAAANAWADFHLGSVSSIGGDIFGQLQGEPRYVTNQSPDMATEFKTRIDLPIRDGEQRGLDAVLAALSPELTATTDHSGCQSCRAPHLCIAGGCRGRNWGFWRGDASIEVVVLAARDDRSSVSIRDALSALRQQVDPLLGRSVRVHGLLPAPGSSCAEMDDQTPSWQTPSWDAVIQLTGGKRYDLCASDHRPALKAVAQRLFGLSRRFFLTRRPLADTIRIELDGVWVGPDAASYDPVTNSVLFSQPPDEMARIRVDYEVDR